MLIPNSLRMEHMPKMVYSLVKLVCNGDYSEDELRKRITASISKEYQDTSKDRFNLILGFAKDSGMISEENGLFKSDFTTLEMESFSEFTYSLLKRMSIRNDNMFDAMLRYYLSADKYVESEFTTSANKFREKVIEDAEVKRFHVEEDSVHGFFFWIEAFEIANFEENRRGHVYYCLENLLIKYLNKHPEIKKMGSLPTKAFLDKLSEDLYFIPFCCETERNRITYPLAQALRILENMEIIDLEYRQDSDQMWHLPKSDIFVNGNTFTNVRVR